MSEIRTDLRFELLRKHAESCTPEELIKHQDYYIEKYGDKGDCPQKSGGVGDALWYMKKLLNKYRPEESMKLRLQKIGVFEYCKDDIEEAYNFYLIKVAAIEQHYGDGVGTAFFAKKTLDMIKYFRPHLSAASREVLLKENDIYEEAQRLYKLYQDEYEEWASLYPTDDFLFDWERKFYYPDSHANQNFQYRIFD